MKLTELNPRWLSCGGEGITNAADGSPVPLRERIGITMDCPCGCAASMFLTFTNPIDGLGPIEQTTWEREGDSFETLTLQPSIQRVGGCAWHGFITSGDAAKC